MKRKFKSFTIILLLLASYTFAQTGIGTATPHASAKLHVSATDKGFLPPRVTLTAATDATTIPSPAEGLLVYNLGSVGLQAGYYYWNGANWSTIATASSPDQTVDYVSVSVIGQTAIGDNRDLIFTSNNGGNIPYNTTTGVFTLSANKTYLFQAQVRANGASTDGSYIEYGFVDATSNTLLVNGTQTITSSTTRTAGFGSNPVINFIYTPTSNQTVKLRTTATTVGTQNITSGTANITQIGSSAIINPWVLSGNDVYNTSGNVGIGTNSPTSKLDVTGNVNIAGALNVNGSSNVNLQAPALLVGTSSGDEGGEIQLASAQTNQSLSGKVVVDVFRNQLRILESGGNSRGVNIDLSKAPAGASGELIWKTSGMVGAGTFVTLDNLKCTVTTGGNRGLSIGAVSTTFEADISGFYAVPGGSGGGSSNNQTITTSASNSAFGWNFVAHSDTAQYYIRDKTNNRFYRVIMMIGASYISNFISIERLF